MTDARLGAMKDECCPECGEPPFAIVPRQTTWRAIETFLQSARFDGTGQAIDERWIHPGSYCSQHGGHALDTCRIPELRDEYEYRVFLAACGQRRKDVILELKGLLDRSLVEAKEIADAHRPLLAKGLIGEVSALCESLEHLGAELEVEQWEGNSGALVQKFESLPAHFSTRRRPQAQTISPGLSLEPVFDDEGNPEGLMDGLTAQYLESDAPDHS